MAEVIKLSKINKIWHGGKQVKKAWIAGSVWQAQATISDFYGVGAGKIAIHLNASNAILNAGGKVTGITNAGGAGAYFNANVNGTPLDRAGNLIYINGTASGIPTLVNPADLMGVRLMWVMPAESFVHNTRHFGYNAGTWGNEIVYLYAAHGSMMRPFTNRPGLTQTLNLSRSPYPATGLQIVEFEITPETIRVYIAGALVSQVVNSLGWSEFLIDRIGQGISGSVPYVGNIGDIIGVTLGAGSDQAIEAARSYLKAKFAI